MASYTLAGAAPATAQEGIIYSTFAHQGGAYDAFQTIYPPLSFVVLKLVSWGPCYAFNASDSADFTGNPVLTLPAAVKKALPGGAQVVASDPPRGRTAASRCSLTIP